MSFFPPLNSSVSGTIGASIIGVTPVNVINTPSPSVIAYQLAGSILATSATVTMGNSSVQVLNPVSLLSVTQGTSPWIINQPSPSIIAYQLAGSVLATSATVNTGNSSVQLLGGVAVVGSVAVLQGTSPWLVNVPTPSYLSIQPGGSVLNANISGSVAAAVTNFTASVAANINVISASIVTNQGTNPWVIGSIVGTYAENSAATAGGVDKGIFVLGVRNDTMSSVTGADLDYTALTVGPVGENIVANAPITKWVQGISSVFTGTSVQVLAPQGSSVFTYVTGVQVTNASANNVYLTFTGGLGGITSTLGYTVAPANGGSNITLPNAWKTGQNSGFSASVSGVASIYLAVEGFISKT